jgi:hypothetical protein
MVNRPNQVFLTAAMQSAGVVGRGALRAEQHQPSTQDQSPAGVPLKRFFKPLQQSA